MSQIPTKNISDQELKVSYWYVTHKLRLKKQLALLLILLSLGLYGYTIYQLTIFSLRYQQSEAKLLQMINSGSAGLAQVEVNVPKNLSFSDISTLSNQTSRQDFLVGAINPNATWLAYFDYQFVYSDGTYSQKHPGFIMPGASKYILDLGQEKYASQLVVSNVRWIKVNDYEQIASQRNRFLVDDKTRTFKRGSGAVPSVVGFALSNESAYGYWNVDVQVFLYSGGSLVGVNEVQFDRFGAGETKNIEMNWHQSLPIVDRVDVVPLTDFLYSKNILPL